MVVLRQFPAHDVVAVYEQGVGGDFRDFDSGKNAPAKDPVGNLAKVRFHSAFGVFELAADPYTVTVSHTALAGMSTTVASMLGLSLVSPGQARRSTIPLIAHGRASRPHYMIAYGSARLASAQIVQSEGSGIDTRQRLVGHHATATHINLSEYANSSFSDLSAVSRTYSVFVFREAVPDPLLPLLGFDGTELILARGRIRSSAKYLRKVGAAESSIDINLGPTMHVQGGATRTVTGGEVYTEPGYTGSFAGPAFVPIAWGA